MRRVTFRSAVRLTIFRPAIRRAIFRSAVQLVIVRSAVRFVAFRSTVQFVTFRSVVQLVTLVRHSVCHFLVRRSVCHLLVRGSVCHFRSAIRRVTFRSAVRLVTVRPAIRRVTFRSAIQFVMFRSGVWFVIFLSAVRFVICWSAIRRAIFRAAIRDSGRIKASASTAVPLANCSANAKNRNMETPATGYSWTATLGTLVLNPCLRTETDDDNHRRHDIRDVKTPTCFLLTVSFSPPLSASRSDGSNRVSPTPPRPNELRCYLYFKEPTEDPTDSDRQLALRMFGPHVIMEMDGSEHSASHQHHTLAEYMKNNEL